MTGIKCFIKSMPFIALILINMELTKKIVLEDPDCTKKSLMLILFLYVLSIYLYSTMIQIVVEYIKSKE